MDKMIKSAAIRLFSLGGHPKEILIVVRRAKRGVSCRGKNHCESNLETNLAGLLERLKSKSYRAKLVRRRYIPKADGKLRPLGIPAVEDNGIKVAALLMVASSAVVSIRALNSTEVPD